MCFEICRANGYLPIYTYILLSLFRTIHLSIAACDVSLHACCMCVWIYFYLLNMRLTDIEWISLSNFIFERLNESKTCWQVNARCSPIIVGFNLIFIFAIFILHSEFTDKAAFILSSLLWVVNGNMATKKNTTTTTVEREKKIVHIIILSKQANRVDCCFDNHWPYHRIKLNPKPWPSKKNARKFNTNTNINFVFTTYSWSHYILLCVSFCYGETQSHWYCYCCCFCHFSALMLTLKKKTTTQTHTLKNKKK